MMTDDERKTNTSNVYYDLVSVLYHSLEGAKTYATYIHDAGGDHELAEFFRQVQQDEVMRADRAKQLLTTRVVQANVSQSDIRQTAPDQGMAH